MTFSNWATEEPDNGQNGEDYIVMKVADKKLYDQSGGFDAADVLCQVEKLTSGTYDFLDGIFKTNNIQPLAKPAGTRKLLTAKLFASNILVSREIFLSSNQRIYDHFR